MSDEIIQDDDYQEVDDSQTPLKQTRNSPVAKSLIKADQDFINNKWRPMMAWTYMAICISDFIVFPVLWSALQALQSGAISTQWQPITLDGAGLLHIAMGAILGITAYGRTREKLQDRL